MFLETIMKLLRHTVLKSMPNNRFLEKSDTVKVASSNTSPLEAHAGFVRLLMKRIS